jgi:hypothetical protein
LHRLLVLAVWLLAVCASARADRAPLPAGVQAVTEVEASARYRLANGLQVLLVPDDRKPTTTVNLTYRVGSRHENYGETGMAHLLEHLMFKGSPTHRNRGRVQPPRPARQRHDVVRPHELLRQLRGQRRDAALVPRLAGRRDGEQLHRAQGPRQRDDGGAQRDGVAARTTPAAC